MGQDVPHLRVLDKITCWVPVQVGLNHLKPPLTSNRFQYDVESTVPAFEVIWFTCDQRWELITNTVVLNLKVLD